MQASQKRCRREFTLLFLGRESFGTWKLLPETKHLRPPSTHGGSAVTDAVIYVPPLTPLPHCKLETTGRNYFSRRAAARSWLKNRANTVYHRPDDSPPRGKLTTRPYRLARAGSQCPFTLINLPVFLFQLYQSDASEDTQH